MKIKINKFTSLFLVVVLSLFAASCSSSTTIRGMDKHGRSGHVHKQKKSYPRATHKKPIPPGQKKKIYGDQSAREHAPGHTKRKYKQKSPHQKQTHHKKGPKAKKPHH